MIDNAKGAGGATVFIVDDEAFNRDIAARYVRKMGYRPVEFADGASVIEALKSTMPDLMLLDIHMPGMNGIEVLRQARSESTKSEFPILMVTADSNSETVVEAFEVGANDYLTKPIDSKTLKVRVETHLHLAFANRQIREFAEGAERIVAEQALDLQKRNEDLVREISLRMKSEEELRSAKRDAESENRAKSEFMAVITHELITPLHIAMGFSDLIARDVDGAISPQQYKEYAGHISNSTRELLTLVKDMLSLVKSDVNALAINESEVNLKSLLEAAVAQARPRPAEKQINVELLCSDQVELIGDRFLLGRGFASLISNAVKFSPAGSDCRIVADVDSSGCAQVTIEDHGAGFDARDIEKMFRPFRQKSEGLARAHQGLGIGLPLAKAAFKLHDASMSIESKVGSGTTVRIAFPKARILSAYGGGLRVAS